MWCQQHCGQSLVRCCHAAHNLTFNQMSKEFVVKKVVLEDGTEEVTMVPKGEDSSDEHEKKEEKKGKK